VIRILSVFIWQMALRIIYLEIATAMANMPYAFLRVGSVVKMGWSEEGAAAERSAEGIENNHRKYCEGGVAVS